jgi:hypothetical protein
LHPHGVWGDGAGRGAPIERIWRYLKGRLAVEPLVDLDAVIDACCHAWNALLAETGRICSICAELWAKVKRYGNGIILLSSFIVKTIDLVPGPKSRHPNF